MLILGVLRAFWCWSFWSKKWASAHICTVFPYQWKDSPYHRQIQPDCQRQILKLLRFSEQMILLEMALIKIILSPTTIDVVAVTKMRRAKPRSFIVNAMICNCFQPAQEEWLQCQLYKNTFFQVCRFDKTFVFCLQGSCTTKATRPELWANQSSFSDLFL